MCNIKGFTFQIARSMTPKGSRCLMKVAVFLGTMVLAGYFFNAHSSVESLYLRYVSDGSSTQASTGGVTPTDSRNVWLVTTNETIKPKVKSYGPASVDLPVQANKKFLKWMKYYSFDKENIDKGLLVLEAFAALADSLNVTSWYICCGTLIGSYRHHQVTPWDLDLDVFVLKKDREKLLEGYKSLDKKLFDLHNDPVWTKIWHKQNVNNGGPWRAPQLDVFYLDQNKTHQWVEKFVHKNEHIYPLVKRPLNGRMFPAPRDPRRNLAELYSKDKDGFFPEIDQCPFVNWDHKHGNTKSGKNADVSIACGKLVKHYPFVKHSRGPGGTYCHEELVYQGEVIDSFLRSAQNIPFC